VTPVVDLTTVLVAGFAGLAAGVPGGITAWAALKEARRSADEAEKGKDIAEEGRMIGIQNKAGIAEVHTITNSRLSELMTKLDTANKAVGELDEVKRQLSAMQLLLSEATKVPEKTDDLVEVLLGIKELLVQKQRRRS